MGIEDIAYIIFDARDDGQPVSTISLRRNAQARNSWSRKVIVVLCCSALVLAALAGIVKYAKQQAALDHLASEIPKTSSKAQQLRVLVDQLQEKRSALVRLRMQKSEAPGLIICGRK